MITSVILSVYNKQGSLECLRAWSTKISDSADPDFLVTTDSVSEGLDVVSFSMLAIQTTIAWTLRLALTVGLPVRR